jgi:hypothetical protein
LKIWQISSHFEREIRFARMMALRLFAKDAKRAPQLAAFTAQMVRLIRASESAISL